MNTVAKAVFTLAGCAIIGYILGYYLGIVGIVLAGFAGFFFAKAMYAE